MAGNIRVTVTGDERVRRVLKGIDPKSNPKFVRRALVKGGLLIQRNAALKQMIKGGKGPPDKTQLTSRTGTGRRSIRVDRAGLSKFFIEIGSDLKYMQLHETGGTVGVRQHEIRSFFRRGKSGTEFVSGHEVRAHQATFPARPYMAPALAAVDQDLEGLFAREWQMEIDKA